MSSTNGLKRKAVTVIDLTVDTPSEEEEERQFEAGAALAAAEALMAEHGIPAHLPPPPVGRPKCACARKAADFTCMYGTCNRLAVGELWYCAEHAELRKGFVFTY